MSLLKPAENQTAYLKAGILGFQGSGKTYTSMQLALGLAKLSKKENPKIAFFDTEKGSDFFITRCKQAGVGLDVARTRSFLDLCNFMIEVEKENYDVAVIDSVSHIWRDLMTSYQKKLNRKNGLQFQDWAAIKLEWQRFTDLFVNSKIHTIVLGRAGYEYDFDRDEETGRKELIKTGTKMKAEGEFGYESDILLEMERVVRDDGKGWINRCYVLKDRTDTMNGKIIDMPKFSDFKTVVQFLNIGGEHFGVDTSRDSQDLFGDPDFSYHAQQKQRDIALEELHETLTLCGLDGTAQQVKKLRTEVLIEFFGSSSKTKLESLKADQIREGNRAIREKYLPKADAPEAKQSKGDSHEIEQSNLS